MRQFIYISLAFLFMSCDKEDISKKEAEAIPSFASLWHFRDAFGGFEDNGTISFKFKHDNIEGLIDQISFRNIAPKEGNFPIFYLKEGSSLNPDFPTAYYRVLVGDDALAETYVIDSSSNLESYIVIDCITKNKVSGSFHLNFVISEFSSTPKFAEYIPDSFYLAMGRFNAKLE